MTGRRTVRAFVFALTLASSGPVAADEASLAALELRMANDRIEAIWDLVVVQAIHETVPGRVEVNRLFGEVEGRLRAAGGGAAGRAAARSTNDLRKRLDFLKRLVPSAEDCGADGAADGTLAGRVVDAAGSAAVAGAEVVVYDCAGYRVGKYRTDASGGFTTGAALRGGTYFLRTTADDFVPTLYGGLDCASGLCDPTTSRPVSVSQGDVVNGLVVSMRRSR